MGTERERRAALHKHAPAAAATPYSRAEDSLERERREAPARRGAEIAVGGVAEKKRTRGCEQRHPPSEPPCPPRERAAGAGPPPEGGAADSSPEPRSAT